MDHSYYLDAFERTLYNDKTLKQHVQERGLKYVHEVQHFLEDALDERELFINAM